MEACIGESSTDPDLGNIVDGEEEMDSEPSISAIEERLMMGQSEKGCASLESELCAVTKSSSVGDFGLRQPSNSNQSCRNFITGAPVNCAFPGRKFGEMVDRNDQIGSSFWTTEEIGTQTVSVQFSSDEVAQLKEQISKYSKERDELRAAYEKENKELKSQCGDLENSLQLMKEEYDKTEDYWHEKLQEARELYEQDKIEADERLQDLLMKIKEYEELVLSPSAGNNERLPPIEERASLERQVTDLEEECEELRHELKSVRMEQETAFSNYQRSYEVKTFILLSKYSYFVSFNLIANTY